MGPLEKAERKRFEPMICDLIAIAFDNGKADPVLYDALMKIIEFATEKVRRGRDADRKARETHPELAEAMAFVGLAHP